MKSKVLIVRNSDHAIFEPIRQDCYVGSPHSLRRLEWKQHRWWFGGKFVPTSVHWQPVDSSEFELVDRKLIELGAKELARRKRPA